MDAAGGGGGTDAPLVGFLRRVEAIEPSEQMKGDDEEWDDYENVSATQCFLKYLEYPGMLFSAVTRFIVMEQ